MTHKSRLSLPRALACALLLFGAAPLRAGIRVDIDGIDGDQRRNVQAFLSLERYKERKDLDEDTVLRLYNRIDEEVRSALKPLGYYEPQVKSTYEPKRKDSDWRIRISIDPGVPVVIESVALGLEGPGAEDPAFKAIREQSVLRKGARLNHGSYEQVKGDLQRTAAAYGYLDAKLLENQLRVDLATHRADIRLRLATGPRYRFGKILIEQSVIRPELMRRFIRFSEGDPYSTAQLLRTQFALDDSLYFSAVEVLPQDRDPQTLTVPIRISAEKGRRAFTLGAGYGTDTGVRGTFGWSDPRINDLGHRFRVQLQASNITRRIEARYDIPFGDPALERISLNFTDRTDVTGGLNTTQLSAGPSVTQVIGTWQRELSLTPTHTTTDDGATREVDNLLVPGIKIASVPEGFLGETLFTRGFNAELIGSTHVLGSNADFLRLHMQGERVFDLLPKWHVLVRGELGASLTRNFENLPGIYRFFAGGDQSVRGFAYNSLSPTETVMLRNGTQAVVSDGGRQLLVGSAELVRDLPRSFAIAAFYDIGNAFNKFGDPLAKAAGIGLRYRLPVVAIGLDIAKPLSQSGSPRLNLNISPKL